MHYDVECSITPLKIKWEHFNQGKLTNSLDIRLEYNLNKGV